MENTSREYKDISALDSITPGTVMLDVNRIQPDPDQPRSFFDPATENDMVDSIKDLGLIQQLVVREAENGQIFLVAGERRLRAAIKAGLKEVPVSFTKADPMVVALTENLQRDDLRPIEKALAFQRMMDRRGYTQEQLAGVQKLSKTTVSETLSLLRLTNKIKAKISEAPAGEYPLRLLVAIAKHEPDEQNRLFRAFEKKLKSSDDIVKNTQRKKRVRAVAGNDLQPAAAPPSVDVPMEPADAKPAIKVALDLTNINSGNKQINALASYLEENIKEENIDDYYDSLQKLEGVINNLLYLAES